MAGKLNRFLGDTPLRVAIKLLVLSFVVGFVMSALGWYPRDIFNGILRFINRVWELGFSVVYDSLEYLILGAAVVIPIFIIMRVLSWRGSSSRE